MAERKVRRRERYGRVAAIKEGAMTEQELAFNQAKAAVLVLRERQKQLSREIDQAANECQRGVVPGSSRLNQLAAEKSETDQAITIAESELQTAQADLDRALRKQDSARFDETLVKIEDQRAKVIAAVREAALAAGTIHELLKEARRIAGGRMSPKWAFVEGASRALRPYDGWDNIVYIPVDLDATIIKILPVKER
jgi:alanyl-tRNA synthetase